MIATPPSVMAAAELAEGRGVADETAPFDSVHATPPQEPRPSTASAENRHTNAMGRVAVSSTAVRG